MATTTAGIGPTGGICSGGAGKVEGVGEEWGRGGEEEQKGGNSYCEKGLYR